jgi:hypothetical protein
MISLQPCSLTKPAECQALVNFAVRTHGRIDVLFNNAAMAYFNWLEDITDEEWNRDLRHSIADIRKREAGLTDKNDRGRGTVCFPEMRRAGINLCVATQIARYVKPGNPLPGWHSPEQAWAQTQGQLAWYRAMEEDGQLVQRDSQVNSLARFPDRAYRSSSWASQAVGWRIISHSRRPRATQETGVGIA